MILYFLAGWIVGAVGVILFIKYWIRRHVVKVTADQMIQDIEKIRNKNEEGKNT